MNKIKKLLGERIRAYRIKQKLTQEKLAEKVQIEVPSLSNIEKGKNYPTPETLEKICIALNVQPSDLYNFEYANMPPIEIIIEELSRAMTEDRNLAFKLYAVYKNIIY